MKKIIFALAIAAFSATAVSAQVPQTPAAVKAVDKNAPKFQFMGGETHDFGNLTDQKNGEYTFEFKNVGKSPLVIASAHGSCGCTIPEFPKEPILPGKKGQIKVTYNTVGKSGVFDKIVFIESNAPSNAGDQYELHIKGNVTPAGQAGSTAAPAPKG